LNSADTWPRDTSKRLVQKGPDSRSLAQTRKISAYFQMRQAPKSRYAGQTGSDFQAALETYHALCEPEACDFYHTIETPSGQIFPGAWDLRGHESTYLGNVDFSGKRVLEVGPASGGLSAYLAKAGADLTVLDLPLGEAPELVPHPSVDRAQNEVSGAASVKRLVNSWWFTKRAMKFKAKAVYADLYSLPSDLGQFDVTIFGSILLHLSNPFRALEEAAARTVETIVVTDVFSAPTHGPIAGLMEHTPTIALFNPTPPPIGVIHWWALSPTIIERMLRLLGFNEIEVSSHSPVNMLPPPPMFTVVGRRVAASSSAKAVGHGALVVTSNDPPIPPARLRFLVSGTEDEQVFSSLGRKGFDAIRDCLERNNISLDGIKDVLDFGCGCGRVTRYWSDQAGVIVSGTDIAQEAIDWASANLSFGSFSVNLGRPPLQYPDSSFDLIYSLSVFTHLPENLQVSWFAELVRVLRPGGYLYVTTHGTFYDHLMNDDERRAFQQGGLVVTGSELPGSNHCAAFHPVRYVESELAGRHGLRLVEHNPIGAAGNPHQDSYLLQKPMAARE
jgi:2-polyprenyl-3-methyl-5-hydroxy-6-metoxy-1,4-benzoquinol methylase